jgi:hypothetical protein
MCDDPCCGVELEVGLAARDGVKRSVPEIADIGEPLRAQQISDTNPGARQMFGYQDSRIVVTSGGPSSASTLRGPTRPAAAADDALAKKSRRDCM